MIPLYDPIALEAWRKQVRLDPEVIRRLRSDLLRSFIGLEAALARLPAPARESLTGMVVPPVLAIENCCESGRDGATKFLLRTAGGALIESVILRILSGRSSVCVSSQTGCGGGCLFCATGRMRQAVNLTAAEILDQVRLAGERLKGEGRRIRNVVFMGMGEPFLNPDGVFGAIDQLTDPAGFHLSARHLLVSTMGIPEGIRNCSRRFPEVGLAISLHSVQQEVRNVLMPLARRWPLSELWEAIAVRNRTTGQPVMIEWLMLDGVTDTEMDLDLLVKWVSGLQVHINLIAFNAPAGEEVGARIHGRPLRGTPAPRFDEFLCRLKKEGLKATRRYSLGADIQAACGQLAVNG